MEMPTRPQLGPARQNQRRMDEDQGSLPQKNSPFTVLARGVCWFDGCRKTVPAAFQNLSTTGEDSWGLQGTHGDNELDRSPLPLFELTTKVARRRRFSKREG